MKFASVATFLALATTTSGFAPSVTSVRPSVSLAAKHVNNKGARKSAHDRPKKKRLSDIHRTPVVYPNVEKLPEYSFTGQSITLEEAYKLREDNEKWDLDEATLATIDGEVDTVSEDAVQEDFGISTDFELQNLNPLGVVDKVVNELKAQGFFQSEVDGIIKDLIAEGNLEAEFEEVAKELKAELGLEAEVDEALNQLKEENSFQSGLEWVANEINTKGKMNEDLDEAGKEVKAMFRDLLILPDGSIEGPDSFSASAADALQTLADEGVAAEKMDDLVKKLKARTSFDELSFDEAEFDSKVNEFLSQYTGSAVKAE